MLLTDQNDLGQYKMSICYKQQPVESKQCFRRKCNCKHIFFKKITKKINVEQRSQTRGPRTSKNSAVFKNS
jgi:hypothetical protein